MIARRYGIVVAAVCAVLLLTSTSGATAYLSEFRSHQLTITLDTASHTAHVVDRAEVKMTVGLNVFVLLISTLA